MILRAILASCCLALSPVAIAYAQPSDGSLQELSYINAATERSISGYIEVISGETLNPILMQMEADPSASAALAPQADAALANLRRQLAAADEAFGLLPENIPDLGDDKIEAALAETRPFLLDFRASAVRQLDLFERQLAALKAGDLEAYSALAFQEVDSTIATLKAENAFIVINIAAQDDSLPVGKHLESIGASNDVIIAMLELLGGFETSTQEEDLAWADEAAEAFRRYQVALKQAEGRTRSFCRQRVERKAREAFDAACGSLSDFNEVSREMEPHLKGYADLAQSIASEGFDNETIPTLETLGVAIDTLGVRRFEIQNQRAENFVKLMQIIN